MVNLRVYLLEKREDYINCFKLYLQNPDLKDKVYAWIEKTFESLGQDEEKKFVFKNLQIEIQQSIQELLKIDMRQTVNLVDQWFDDEY